MRNKKILYVGDDLSLIEGLKYTLEKNGFTMDNTHTVKEAHQFFHAGQYYRITFYAFLIVIMLPLARLGFKNIRLHKRGGTL